MTLTKEWLLRTIAELEEERDATPGAVNEDAARALAAMKIALASLEAEHAGFIVKHKVTGKFGSWLHSKADWFRSDEYEVLSAYTTPPAPVSVPDEVISAIENLKRTLVNCNRYNYCSDAVKRLENACRTAMLQGAEPVKTANKLPEPIKTIVSIPGRRMMITILAIRTGGMNALNL